MEDQTTVALMAHGMLTSLSVVRASLWLTATSEDREVRERVMEHGMEQITLITDILVDLARGLSPEALDLLQEARRPQLLSAVYPTGSVPDRSGEARRKAHGTVRS